MQRRTKHPEEVKNLCVSEIRAGRPFAAVSKQRRVKESTIRGWVQRAHVASNAASAAQAVIEAAPAATQVVAQPASIKVPQVSSQRALSQCKAERLDLRDAVAQLSMENIALRRRLSE